MMNHLPGWLNEILDIDKIRILHNSFLEDKHLQCLTNDFELEWQEHSSLNMIKTWGFNANQRLEQLLIETETDLEELSNLKVLDAGCGNGILTETIAGTGAKVIGLDVINNLFEITKERKSAGNLFFLHADINNLPIKESSFDLVISNGVLHHTPDTKKAFLHLAKRVKTEGKLYVWLYRKPFKLKNRIFLLGSDFLRSGISRLPKNIQKLVVKGFTGLFYNLSKLRKGRNSLKTYDDILIDMYDSFTPKYRYYHNPIEVAGWFHEASFSAPILTHWDNSFGFGMYAVKRTSKLNPAGENFGSSNFNNNIHLS